MSIFSPGFINGPLGAIFLTVYLPDGEVTPRHVVIHVPAFGEEMNKSRHMVSRQARALADSGIAVVVPDLYGAGESSLEFESIDWRAWKAQLSFLLEWVRSESELGITLWGHRLGCLLAADVVRQHGEGVQSLLFWQPVYSGKQFMGQFLRLRMAAAMMKGEDISVASLQENLRSGNSIEIAGYLLSSELYCQLAAVEMGTLVIPSRIQVNVHEVVSAEKGTLSPVTRRRLDEWQSLGVSCAGRASLGDPFWMTQELGFSDELIGASLAGMDALQFMPDGSRAGPDTSVHLDFQLEKTNPDEGLRAVIFGCEKATLTGILHETSGISSRGVLVVVGGPQYRVGSHRQFVYLARELAAQGIPVFRFDYRGMGDSTGDLRGFEEIQEDIRCAVDAFIESCEGLEEVAIWGLCDAATAATFYAPTDERITGLVLANPWVYSASGAAKAYLKHYYIDRFFSRALWQKVLRGEYKPLASARSLLGMAFRASRSSQQSASAIPAHSSETANVAGSVEDLAERLADGLDKFPGKILLILSGEDLTAAEFSDVVKGSRTLRRILSEGRVQLVDLDGADHTFSEFKWRAKVDQLSAAWVSSY